MEAFASQMEITTAEELEFVIFCIEETARRRGVNAELVYDALKSSGILGGYLVPEYLVLHTQGKSYILDDIENVMAERGVTP